MSDQPINVPLKASLDGAAQVKTELENIKRLMTEVADLDPKGKLKSQLGQLTTSFATLGSSLGNVFGGLSKGLESELQGAQAKAKAGGKKIVKEIQDEVDKTSVKVRISSTTVLLPNGVRARVSGDIADLKELNSAFDTLMGKSNTSSADTNARILKDVRFKKLELDQKIEVAKSILDASKLGMSTRDLESQFGPRAVRASKSLVKMEAEQDARAIAQIDRDLETQQMASARKLASDLAKLDGQTKLEKLQRGNATDAEALKQQMAANASATKLDGQTKLEKLQRGNQADAELLKQQQAAAQARLSATAAELKAVSTMEIQEERARRLRRKQELSDELRDRDLNARFNQLSPAAQLTRATRVASIATDDAGAAYATRKFGSAAVAASEAQSLATLAAETNKLSAAQGAVAKSSGSSASAARNLREEKVKLTQQSRELHSALRGVAGSLGGLFLTYGSLAPLAGAFFATGAIKTAIQDYVELEFRIKTARAVSEDFSQTTQSMMQQVSDSARAVGVMPLEAAKAYQALAQSGLSAAESLQALPTVLDVAAAGEISAQQATLALTGAMNAFGLQANSLGRIGDVFVKAGALSSTSVEQISESMKSASTVAQQYRLTVEEVGMSLVALAKRNITGSAAGTAFTNMMTELATPKGPALQLSKKLGLTLFDPTAMEFKDLYGKFLPDLRKKLAGYTLESQTYILNTLTNNRGAKMLSAMLGMSDKEIGDTLKKLNDATAAAAKVVVERNDSVQGDLNKMKSTYSMVSAKMGAEAEGALRSLLQEITSFVQTDAFAALLRSLVSVLTLLGGAAKTAMAIVDGVYTGLQKLRDTFEGVWSPAGLVGVVGTLGLASVAALTLASRFGAAAAASTVLSSGMYGVTMSSGTAAAALATAGGVAARLLAFSGIGLMILGVGYALTELYSILGNKSAAQAAEENADRILKKERELTETLERQVRAMREKNGIKTDAESVSIQTDVAVARGAFTSYGGQSKLDEYKAEMARVSGLTNAQDKAGQEANAKSRFKDILEADAHVKVMEVKLSQQEALRKRQEVATAARRAKELADEAERKKHFNDQFNLGPDGKPRKDLLTLGPEDLAAKSGAVKDNSSQQVMKQYATDLSLAKSFSESKMRVLNAQRSAGLISQEGFYAAELSLAEKSEQAQLKIIDDRLKARTDAYKADVARVNAESDEKSKFEKLLNLARAFQTDSEAISSDEQKAIDAANTRTLLQEYRLQGDLKKVRDDARSFERSEQLNDAKRLRAAGSREEALKATPEQAQVLSARAAEYERLSSRVAEYENSIQSLNNSLADDIAYRESLGPLSEEARAEIDKETAAVKRLVDAKRSAKDRLESQIPGRVTSAGDAAAQELARTKAAEADWLLGAETAFETYRRAAGNTAAAMNSMFTGAFKGMEDSLVSFVMTGKLDFGTLARSIIADMVRISIQKRILGLFDMFGGGLPGAIGRASGATSFVPGMSAVGAGDLNITSMPGLPPFAAGTDYVPNDMIAQIHKGERIIPAEQNAAMQRAWERGDGQQSSQAPVTVIQNFTVGDVASMSDVRTAVSGSEKRIQSALARSRKYGGVAA